MNIKKQDLKNIIKQVIRENLSEREQIPVDNAGKQIPKGKLSQLNPNIIRGGNKNKLTLPSQKKVKEEEESAVMKMPSQEVVITINGKRCYDAEKRIVALGKTYNVLPDKIFSAMADILQRSGGPK